MGSNSVSGPLKPVVQYASVPAPPAGCTCPSSERVLHLQHLHRFGLDQELHLLKWPDSVTAEKRRYTIQRVVTVQTNVFGLFYLCDCGLTRRSFTCMMMNSTISGSLLISPAGRSNRKEAFHTVQDPPSVCLLLITTPSWCKLITTRYSAHRYTKVYCEVWKKNQL